jgi:ATP-dependent Lhr-like helicase
VLRESFREIIEDRFEVENIKEVLRGLAGEKIEVVVKRGKPPGPMAFGLAALGAASGEKRERMREMQRAIVKMTENVGEGGTGVRISGAPIFNPENVIQE